MNAEGFRVRVAQVTDLDNVVALERSVVEAPHWVEAEYAAAVGDDREDREIDSAVRRRLLVAEAEGSEGRLLGFAVGKVIGSGAEGVAELESVAVVEAARRIGMGRSLCQGILVWCKEAGLATVELEVRAGNGGAIALYEGLGFLVVGRRRGYYRAPVEDAKVMRLELAEAK